MHDRSFQVQLIISFDKSFLDVLIYIGFHQRALGTHSYNFVRSNSIIRCYRQLINDAAHLLEPVHKQQFAHTVTFTVAHHECGWILL